MVAETGFCDACQSPVGCAGSSLCLIRNACELDALKTLLAGHICGCQRPTCPKVEAALGTALNEI